MGASGGEDDRTFCRSPGRPRNPGVDEAILAVTQRALAEEGYARMSIAAIAAEAGVSKPTLYRRWKSKADLATAAIAAMQIQDPPATTGETRDDLIANLRNLRQSLERPLGMAMIGTLLVEERHNPDLLALFRERIVRTRRRWMQTVLEAARERGDIRPDIDVDVVVTILVGPFYAAYLAGDPLPPDWAERVIDTIWRGIAAPAPEGKEP